MYMLPRSDILRGNAYGEAVFNNQLAFFYVSQSIFMPVIKANLYIVIRIYYDILHLIAPLIPSA